MEQQSGANGWNTRMEAPTPEPGQLTLWTMQSIAHGADYVSYFRWRTATMGTEIYWHGILDYSGRDNRRLSEVRSVYEKMQKIQNVSGARYQANVGILTDYDNIFDSQLDVWHGRVEKTSQKALFEACQLTHTPFDYCYLDHVNSVEELSRYQVLFYPHATIMDGHRKELLEAYVQNGGTLVVACRSGYKDVTGQCVMDYLPGMLKEVTGTDIPEYTFISPAEGRTVKADWDGTEIEAAVFNDLLAPEEGARIAAVYTSSYYEGTPALICHPYGKGQAYYFGGAFTEKTAEVFLEKLGVKSPYRELIQLPESCELTVREKDGVQYLFVMNYQKESVIIILKQPVKDLLAGMEVQGEQTLEGYGTRVYRM